MSTDKKQVINTIQDNGGLGCVIRYRFVKGEPVGVLPQFDLFDAYVKAEIAKRMHTAK